MVGGNIILKFFLGDKNPESVVKAYHRYIKGFSIPPFWSLGHHQSRWGYSSSQNLIEIRDTFDKFDLPLDVMWNDLDYMQDYQGFTLNPTYKPEEMNQLTDMSKDNGVQWVPLIDIGVAVGTPAADNGLERGVFLNSSVYDHTLIGCVWPGSVHFLDFNHPDAHSYWNDTLYSMRTVLNTNPGGYWIDMNEYSSFIAGERHIEEECPGANPPYTPSVKPEIDDNLYLPY
jgi:alpha-glucosidase